MNVSIELVGSAATMGQAVRGPGPVDTYTMAAIVRDAGLTIEPFEELL